MLVASSKEDAMMYGGVPKSPEEAAAAERREKEEVLALVRLAKEVVRDDDAETQKTFGVSSACLGLVTGPLQFTVNNTVVNSCGQDSADPLFCVPITSTQDIQIALATMAHKSNSMNQSRSGWDGFGSVNSSSRHSIRLAGPGAPMQMMATILEHERRVATATCGFHLWGLHARSSGANCSIPSFLDTGRLRDQMDPISRVDHTQFGGLVSHPMVDDDDVNVSSTCFAPGSFTVMGGTTFSMIGKVAEDQARIQQPFRGVMNPDVARMLCRTRSRSVAILGCQGQILAEARAAAAADARGGRRVAGCVKRVSEMLDPPGPALDVSFPFTETETGGGFPGAAVRPKLSVGSSVLTFSGNTTGVQVPVIGDDFLSHLPSKIRVPGASSEVSEYVEATRERKKTLRFNRDDAVITRGKASLKRRVRLPSGAKNHALFQEVVPVPVGKRYIDLVSRREHAERAMRQLEKKLQNATSFNKNTGPGVFVLPSTVTSGVLHTYGVGDGESEDSEDEDGVPMQTVLVPDLDPGTKPRVIRVPVKPKALGADKTKKRKKKRRRTA